MEEKTKRRVTVAVTIALGICYFFLFATPLPKPLILKPVWASDVPASYPYANGSPNTKQHLLSFEIGDKYGYFDMNSGLVFSATRGYGVGISDTGYVAWDMKPGIVTFKDPRGVVLFSGQLAGYPFVDGDRRFVVSSNQSEISELGADGSLLWKSDFPSLVTAFASNEKIAVFGTLDGEIFAMDHHGKELLSFAPGGSRVACIYGCAISPDGKTIAATTGLDKQRVVVLEKRAEAYRVTWHRWTNSDFRGPVAMAFTPDGKELVFETTGGFGIYDVRKRKEHMLPARNPSVTGASIPSRDILLALDNADEKDIVAASYDGRQYFRFPFQAADATLRSRDGSLFMGLLEADSADILRLDFVEE